MQRGECCFCPGVSGQPEQLLKVEVTIFFTLFSLFSSKLSIIFYSCIVLYCIDLQIERTFIALEKK